MARTLAAAAALLLLLNFAVYGLTDIVSEAPMSPPPPVTYPPEFKQLDGHDWVGVTLPDTEAQKAILAPAVSTRREYRNINSEPVWVVHLQTAAAGKLHNVMDSLIASGGAPEVLGERIVRTRRGPLKASLITFQDTRRYAFLALYWYQWDTETVQPGSAPGRWSWYGEVFQRRLLRRPTQWQLVEAIVPKSNDRASDLRRLEAFAAALYEAAPKTEAHATTR